MLICTAMEKHLGQTANNAQKCFYGLFIASNFLQSWSYFLFVYGRDIPPF